MWIATSGENFMVLQIIAERRPEGTQKGQNSWDGFILQTKITNADPQKVK
jgi:hypothetical protein